MMNKSNFFNLSKEQQLLVINQSVPQIGLPPQAIEKDIWVSTVLQIVFTLPFADKLIFKGGTSLSKVWKVINRFSEDIDLAVDRSLFELEGDLTKKKIKKLRKESSVFVKETFVTELLNKLEEYGIGDLCDVEAEPDGEGDATYPEPRKILIHYSSALENSVDYLKPVVVLEIGSRSLFEPNKKCRIQSMLETQLPSFQTTLVDADITTAVPEKTFLEKVFLIHELFSVKGRGSNAERKSRHLYDIYRMMNMDFAVKAIADNQLWESIRHHREMFTSISGVDYTPDVRKRLQLVPRPDIIDVWKSDYETMMELMVYGDKPSFNELLSALTELQERFHESAK